MVNSISRERMQSSTLEMPPAPADHDGNIVIENAADAHFQGALVSREVGDHPSTVVGDHASAAVVGLPSHQPRQISHHGRLRRDSAHALWKNASVLELRARLFVATIGFSSMWKFPLHVYQYGFGNVALIHIIVLFVCIFPLLVLDMGMGQFSGKGPLRAFKAALPFFRGLGFACCLLAWILSVFNGIFFAWNILYVFSSFTDELPWDGCNGLTGSPNCFSTRNEALCRLFDSTFYNLSCIPFDTFCDQVQGSSSQDQILHLYHYNDTPGYCEVIEVGKEPRLVSVIHLKRRRMAAEDFFERVILNALRDENDGSEALHAQHATTAVILEESKFRGDIMATVRKSNKGGGSSTSFPGQIHVPMILATAVSWALFGVRVAFRLHARRAYIMFASTVGVFAVLMIFVFLATFPGFSSALKDAANDAIAWHGPRETAEAWVVVAQEAFLTYGIGAGFMMKIASYRPFHSELTKSALFITLATLSISLVMGLTVVGCAGILGEMLGVRPKEVAWSETSISFLVTSHVLAQLPVPTLSSFLYYIFVSIILLEAQVITFGTSHIAVYEVWPWAKHYKQSVALAMAFLSFVVSIPMTTRGGRDILLALSEHGVGIPLFVNVLLTLVVFVFIHGRKRLEAYFQSMGADPRWLIKAIVMALMTLAPAIVLLGLVGKVILLYLTNLEDRYHPFTQALCIVVALIILLPIPFSASLTLFSIMRHPKENSGSSAETSDISRSRELPDDRRRIGSQDTVTTWKEAFQISPYWQPATVAKRRIRVSRRSLSESRMASCPDVTTGVVGNQRVFGVGGINSQQVLSGKEGANIRQTTKRTTATNTRRKRRRRRRKISEDRAQNSLTPVELTLMVPSPVDTPAAGEIWPEARSQAIAGPSTTKVRDNAYLNHDVEVPLKSSAGHRRNRDDPSTLLDSDVSFPSTESFTGALELTISNGVPPKDPRRRSESRRSKRSLSRHPR